MKNETKKECCNGCLRGKPGGNASCQAKLVALQLHAENNTEKDKNQIYGKL